MVKAALSYALSVVLKLTPKWLASWIYPPKKIAENVTIDLRSDHPIDFGLRHDVPNVMIWFRISNQSLIDLELERFLVDFWVG